MRCGFRNRGDRYGAGIYPGGPWEQGASCASCWRSCCWPAGARPTLPGTRRRARFPQAVPLGSTLSLDGPHGRIEPRLGGLAANGVPNLAGALISAQQAMALGVPGPTMLLVGIAPGASLDAVSGTISHMYPQATVNPLV